MEVVNYFKDLFESISHYRKEVLITFLLKMDNDLIKERGFLESDNNRLCLEIKTILIEQNEEYLNYIKKEE